MTPESYLPVSWRPKKISEDGTEAEAPEPLPVKKITAMDSPEPEPTDLEKFLGVSGGVKKVSETAGRKEVLRDDPVFKKIIELEAARIRREEKNFPGGDTAGQRRSNDVKLREQQLIKSGDVSADTSDLLGKVEQNEKIKEKINKYLSGIGKTRIRFGGKSLRSAGDITGEAFGKALSYGSIRGYGDESRFVWNPKEWWRIQYGG